MGKAILFSAPSGCGKTTIINSVMNGGWPLAARMAFSISATSRRPREGEVDGRDYYFLSCDESKARVAAGDFLEWEEVYEGTCYGTLKSEVERLWTEGKVVVFDVDVNGGRNISLLLFNIFFIVSKLSIASMRLLASSINLLKVLFLSFSSIFILFSSINLSISFSFICLL